MQKHSRSSTPYEYPYSNAFRQKGTLQTINNLPIFNIAFKPIHWIDRRLLCSHCLTNSCAMDSFAIMPNDGSYNPSEFVV